MEVDLELIIDRLTEFFRDNFNTEITAINTAKNDTLLTAIDPLAFILGDMENTNKNFKQFILIQPTGVTATFAGSAVAQEFRIEILMFMMDNYEIKQSWRKIYRYQKAMLRTAQLAWLKLRLTSQPDIIALDPISYQENQKSVPMKIFGLELTFTIS